MDHKNHSGPRSPRTPNGPRAGPCAMGQHAPARATPSIRAFTTLLPSMANAMGGCAAAYDAYLQDLIRGSCRTHNRRGTAFCYNCLSQLPTKGCGYIARPKEDAYSSTLTLLKARLECKLGIPRNVEPAKLVISGAASYSALTCQRQVLSGAAAWVRQWERVRLCKRQRIRTRNRTATKSSSSS